MNDKLRAALKEIVQAVGPSWSPEIENSLANSKCQILAIRPTAESNSSSSEPNSSPAQANNSCMRLGGQPLMPRDFVWPQDGHGLYMQFVLQIDTKNIIPPPQLSVDMPASGRLTVFRSRRILVMNDKDRKAFHFHFEGDKSSKIIHSAPDQNQQLIPLKGHTFTVEDGWALDLERLNKETLACALPQNFAMALLGWAEKYNLSICAAGHFFGGGKNVEEEKVICAFAAGGISYDHNRAKDSHYSHLVALKDNWILLARINERLLFETAISTTDILIQAEDLAQGLFERAWVISR